MYWRGGGSREISAFLVFSYLFIYLTQLPLKAVQLPHQLLISTIKSSRERNTPLISVLQHLAQDQMAGGHKINAVSVEQGEQKNRWMNGCKDQWRDTSTDSTERWLDLLYLESRTLRLWLLQWKNQHRKKNAIHRVWQNVKIFLLEIRLDCIINWKLFPPMFGPSKTSHS